MRPIRVKALFGAWQGYQEIVNHPPEGVKYVGISGETKKGEYYQRKKIKEKVSVLIQKLKIPRIIFIWPGKYDLIHSSRGIIPITNKPWVMDIEHVHSFFGLNPNLIKKKFWKKFIEKRLASKNCRGILCHCEATRKSFYYYLDCNKFKEKIKVLYPASQLFPIKKDKHKKIRILSVISIFNNKSGPQILKAFSELNKRYSNIELWFKADTPITLKRRYLSKSIKYAGYLNEIIPRRNLLEDFYFKCDIFLYPTLTDSFGYSLIDALVAKLPIISTNLFAVPEIVEDGKNGFIIKIPGYDLNKEYSQGHPWTTLKGENEKRFIKDLIINLEKLIKNKKLREDMGKESFKKVEKERFSIEERNKKLKKIYEEALK